MDENTNSNQADAEPPPRPPGWPKPVRDFADHVQPPAAPARGSDDD